MSDTYIHDGEECEEINAFYPGYWPEEWDESDIEFLAGFLQSQLHVHLVKEYGSDEVEWSLRVPQSMKYFTEEPYHE